MFDHEGKLDLVKRDGTFSIRFLHLVILCLYLSGLPYFSALRLSLKCLLCIFHAINLVQKFFFYLICRFFAESRCLCTNIETEKNLLNVTNTHTHAHYFRIYFFLHYTTAETTTSIPNEVRGNWHFHYKAFMCRLCHIHNINLCVYVYVLGYFLCMCRCLCVCVIVPVQISSDCEVRLNEWVSVYLFDGCA